MLKNKSGITLIALIVTIIVLIILAGISINLLMGDNGILKKAKGVNEAQAVNQRKEAVSLALTSEYANKLGDRNNITVEGVLKELRNTQENGNLIYALKGSTIISAEEGTTQFPAAILFPDEMNGNVKKGIVVTIDENQNITNAYLEENIETVDNVVATIEVGKAVIELNDVWTNGVPSVTYRETSDANVTLKYMVGENDTLKDLPGKEGTITDNNITLGKTVYVIAVSNGKQSNAATIDIKDENGPEVELSVKAKTSDSVTIEVTAEDKKVGLKTQGTYTYYQGEEQKASNETNTYKYENLEPGNYTFKVVVEDKVGNKTTKTIDVIVEEPITGGLFDENDNLVASWKTLTETYNLNINKNYNTYSNAGYNFIHEDGNSMYYVLKNNSELANGTKIIIQDGVTNIGSYSFYGCENLTSVIIPDTATAIQSDAFSRCTNLANIELGNSLTRIGQYAFQSCSGLTSITIPNSVTSLDIYAFQSCSNLENVTMSNNIEYIRDGVFNYCKKLSSIKLPSTLKSIGNYAFGSCSNLTSIEIDSGNTKYDSRNNCNAIIETSTNKLIRGCKNTIIPNGVTSIMSNAFNTCVGLENIEIPNTVTAIGGAAFSDCKQLKNITIPNSVTNMEAAFSNCTDLTSITIGTGVTSIKNSTFTGCRKLRTVEMSNNVTSIGERAFYNCEKLTNMTLSNSLTTIGTYAFYQCKELTNVEIPDSVTTIGDYAFYACNKIKTITIGKGLTNIGTSIFNCSGVLESIVVDSENTTYDSRDNCNGFIETETNKLILGCKNTTIPVGILIINDNAFYTCSNLESIEIPNTVTHIGNAAFYWYTAIKNLEIPDSVTSIGSSAFAYSSQLKTVTLGNSLTTIGESAFRTCGNITSIVIPSSVTTIGVYAFGDCSKLTSITFENTTGWKAGSTEIDVTDAAQNATNFRNTYKNVTWTRTDPE